MVICRGQSLQAPLDINLLENILALSFLQASAENPFAVLEAERLSSKTLQYPDILMCSFTIASA